MASSNNENNSSINENAISIPLSPPSAPNSSMTIENNVNQSNGISNVPNAMKDSAPSSC